MKLKFPYDAVETEDKKMGMFSRKDMVRLFGPLLVEQLLAVLVGMADVVMVAAVGETAVSGVGAGGFHQRAGHSGIIGYGYRRCSGLCSIHRKEAAGTRRAAQRDSWS